MADVSELSVTSVPPVAESVYLDEEYVPAYEIGYTGDDPVGNSLVVRWTSVRRPYRFDRVTYLLDGVERTSRNVLLFSSGCVIGRIADLTTDTYPSSWRISGITVHFEVDTVEVVVTTQASPENGGTTTPARLAMRVVRGERWSALLTATPAQGYKFLDWTLEGSSGRHTSASWFVSGVAGADTELNYIAHFSPKTSGSDPPAPDAPYAPGHDPGSNPSVELAYIVVYVGCDPDGVADVSIGTAPGGGVTAQTYTGYPGAAVIVTCAAQRKSPDYDNYKFYRWSSTEASGVNTTAYADGSGGTMRVALEFPAAGTTKVVRFIAEFKRNFKITTTASPQGAGATFGDGDDYEEGDICHALAFEGANSKFLWWENAEFPGQRLSLLADYSFAVDDDIDLVAVFHIFTGLILRSRNSGIIFRNASGKIVRDGDP